MSPPTIEDLLSRATDSLRELLREAYEAGRESMKSELAAFLTSGSSHHTTVRTAIPVQMAIPVSEEARATPGTVKPRIMALIEYAKDGITTSEIIEKTGFKENSVRGTLSALKAEGFAERHGEFWYLSQRKGSLTAASEPS